MEKQVVVCKITHPKGSSQLFPPSAIAIQHCRASPSAKSSIACRGNYYFYCLQEFNYKLGLAFFSVSHEKRILYCWELVLNPIILTIYYIVLRTYIPTYLPEYYICCCVSKSYAVISLFTTGVRGFFVRI